MILGLSIVIVATVLAVVATACSQTSASNAQDPKKKILIVLSAAKTWTRADGSLYPTGYWAEEFVVMHEKFVQAGFEVDLATPGGVEPTADPKSLDPKVAEKAPEFARYLGSIAKDLKHPIALAKVNMYDYGAVVVPGGHGPVEDLYKDKDMGRVLVEADRANYTRGEKNWGEFIVRDRNMISGQNPASTAPMAEAVIEDLKKL